MHKNEKRSIVETDTPPIHNKVLSGARSAILLTRCNFKTATTQKYNNA